MSSVFFTECLCGGTASCIAEALTLPLDAIKVHSQTHTGFKKNNSKKRISFQEAFVAIINKKGGYKNLYSGLTPALLRQATYGSLKYGLFTILQSYGNNFICGLLAGWG